jgi:hypothetical protein
MFFNTTTAGWDPRGVGKTIPRADCFDSQGTEDDFWKETIPRHGLEARGNMTDRRELVAFVAQIPEVDRLLNELGQKCLDYSPDTLQYVGTVATVRDMVALHDELEKTQKLVNFWGFS